MKAISTNNWVTFALALGQELDENVVIGNALDVFLSWPIVDAAWIYLANPTGDLRLVSSRAREGISLFAIDVDEVAAGAFGARAPGLAVLPPINPSGLRTIASSPLTGQGEQIGVLVLGSLGHLSDIEFLSDLGRLLSAAIVNARRYAQARHLRDRLAALHAALTLVQRAGGLREEMQVVANALHNMGWGQVSLWLCDSNLSVSEVVYAGVSFQDEMRLRQSASRGAEVYHRSRHELDACQLGPGYWVRQAFDSDPAVWQPGDVLYVPLLSAEADSQSAPIIGSIELRNPAGGLCPLEDELKIIGLFAREAAHEIERARQADLRQQQVQDLGILYETSAAFFSHRDEGTILTLLNRALRDVTDVGRVSFADLDLNQGVARYVSHYPQSSIGAHFPPSYCQLASEVVDKLVNDRQPHLAHSAEGSMLYMPMTLGGQFLGVVEICASQPEHVFAERQVALCHAIINQAAIALSYSRLYQRTDVERGRLRAILEASHEGIVLISPEATLLDLNGAACRLLRLAGEPEDWVGRSVLALVYYLHRLSPAAARFALSELRRIQKDSALPGRGDFDLGGAAPVFLRYSIYPVQASSLQTTGWVLVLHDVTEERELARTRDDLTHMLVHDLRSPLTAIISTVNLLGGGVAHGQDNMLEIVQRNSERMLDMVDTILDIARLETGQIHLNWQPVSVNALYEKVVSELTPTANERSITLSVAAASELPLVQADSKLVERVVNNLVNNALKFTSPGETITLDAQVQGRFLALSVADSGAGIEPDLRDRLFQKFVTGKQAGRGSGLGLAFCKLVVEAHGGHIGVESPAPGLPASRGPGSVFAFTLPLYKVTG